MKRKKKFPMGKNRKDRSDVTKDLDENLKEDPKEDPKENEKEKGAGASAPDPAGPAEAAEENKKDDGAEDGENAGSDSLLAEALKKAEKKCDEYLDMAQRVQADFDNYRRRNASLRAESFEDGAREAIKLMLPVVDNLERALEAPSEDEKLREGVAMTLRQMMAALEKRGVTVIDRKGEKFDPRLENAVMQVDASQGEPGTVAMVLQKGYKMGDVVLRHAMVQVVAE